MKTASEISQNKEILQQIDQQDAHMIGYITASDAMLEENRIKETLLKKVIVKDKKTEK